MGPDSRGGTPSTPLMVDSDEEEYISMFDRPPRPHTMTSSNRRSTSTASSATLRGDSEFEGELRRLSRMSLDLAPTKPQAQLQSRKRARSPSITIIQARHNIPRKSDRNVLRPIAQPRLNFPLSKTSQPAKPQNNPSNRGNENVSNAWNNGVIPVQEAIIIDDEDADEVNRAHDLDELQAKLLELARQRPNAPPRNLPIIHPLQDIPSTKWKTSTLRPLKFLKLTNGLIFRIKLITKNTLTSEILLRGWVYKYTGHLHDLIDQEHRAHEYVLELQIDEDDPRPPLDQCVSEIKLGEIERVVKVNITNELFPAHSNINDLRDIRKEFGKGLDFIRQNEVFVVRWKYITVYKTSQIRRYIDENPGAWSSLISGRRLEAFTEEECSPGCYKSPHQLRYNFRGQATVLGGAFTTEIEATGSLQADRSRVRRFNVNSVPGPLQAGTATFINLEFGDDENEGKVKKRKKNLLNILEQVRQQARLSARLEGNGRKLKVQSYTYGDGFCGAGGMTRGAYMSNLKINFGFDANSHAVASWTANFPHARCYRMWAHEFLSIPTSPSSSSSFVVDILHLSPPCQFFSPAHTRNGPDDEMNTASLFSVGLLLDKCKPRIVTIEETFGLLTSHKTYFNALIRMFTCKGFSVSWQIVRMEELGLPQERRRLMVVASCPGETLPPLITATHASPNSPSTLPHFQTPHDVLQNIPHDAENHEIPAARTRYTPWDAKKLIKTITCAGTISHPSLPRSATLHEIQRLMGFPSEHVFRGGQIRKQIGNSVPPVCGAAVLRGIKSFLKASDRKVGEEVRSEDESVVWTKRGGVGVSK